RARRYGLDMDEVKRRVVRRIAVEMKQWERGRGHDRPSISEAVCQANACNRTFKIESPAPRAGLPLLVWQRVSGSAVLAGRHLAGRPGQAAAVAADRVSARHLADRRPAVAGPASGSDSDFDFGSFRNSSDVVGFDVRRLPSGLSRQQNNVSQNVSFRL